MKLTMETNPAVNVAERLTHRFAKPSDEQKDIERIWHEVQDKTGFHVKTSPAEPSLRAALHGNPIDVAVSPERHTVEYSLGITDILTDSQLSGVMAHELGHFAHPGFGRESEVAADQWGAAHGFGEESVSAMTRMDEYVAAHRDEAKEIIGDHPEVAERIAIIRAAEPKL